MTGAIDTPEIVPARMLNEMAYCPRLAYLEWVQGEFADNADTVDGRFRHRRVDQPSGDLRETPLQDEDGTDDVIHARSVLLSDTELGATARIDLVEAIGDRATPVDYKRGTVPDVPGNAYEPERVQLCVQGLLLRAHGYQCDGGVLYFVGSKRRVPVPFDDALEDRTRELLLEARAMADGGTIPPPLRDSPKCPRCSLVGICLPDEVTFLSESRPAVRPDDVRRMVAARDDALPLYVITQGATVGKSGDTLEIRTRNAPVVTARLLDVSSLSIFGNVQVTAPAMRELLDRNIPVCHFSYGGWLRGVTWGMAHKNVELRIAQFRMASEGAPSLLIAGDIVVAKIRNSRVMLRRNHPDSPTAAVQEMSRLARNADGARDIRSLLGFEGAAARVYFSNFDAMLKTRTAGFEFQARNRRPPTDPVNAMLSFLYALLTRQATVSALAVGFDPYLGFYHQPRYGRPALALDLAEEFRAIIADSAALTLFNNGELRDGHFIRRHGAVALTQDGRRRAVRAFERRMDALIRHPLFGYSVSYRRVMELQARLLGRHLLGELQRYPAFTTR